MHEGDHGIMDHTHEELDKKFGNTGDHGHHPHKYSAKGSDLGVKIGAAIVVLIGIGIFVVYRMV